MSAAIAWLLRHPLSAALLIVCAVLVASLVSQSLSLGAARRSNAVLLLIAAERARESAEALATAQAHVRQQEQQAAVKLAAIGESHQEELTHVRQAADADIAGLRAGSLRLRQSLAQACPAGMPAADAGTGGSDDAATSAVVSREAQERILRIGADADEVKAQLVACQAVVRADRAAP